MILESMEDLGLRKQPYMFTNGDNPHGCGHVPRTVYKGDRTTADGYFVNKGPNLAVKTETTVDKVILEGEGEGDKLKAVAVKVIEKDGSMREIKATKEIIVMKDSRPNHFGTQPFERKAVTPWVSHLHNQISSSSAQSVMAAQNNSQTSQMEKTPTFSRSSPNYSRQNLEVVSRSSRLIRKTALLCTTIIFQRSWTLLCSVKLANLPMRLSPKVRAPGTLSTAVGLQL